MFAKARTKAKMEGKLQGFETPSQKRYVYQLDQLLKKQRLYFDAYPKLPVAPPKSKISLKALSLDGPVLFDVEQDGQGGGDRRDGYRGQEDGVQERPGPLV